MADRGFGTVGILTTWLVLGSGHTLGQDPAPVASALFRVKQALPGSWTLEVQVEQPVNLFQPGQGNVTRVMRATVGDDITAIVWQTPDLPALTYHAPETTGEPAKQHDANGNLQVSTWLRRATFRDQAFHEEYAETVGFLVAPDGTILGQSSGASLDRRRPSDSNTISWNLLRRVLWALGRPWLDGRETVLSDVSRADGTQHLRARVWWGSSPTAGVSELVVEPANGSLVRRATFGADGAPAEETSLTTGTRQIGDVALGERGEFRLPIETISVRLISFSAGLDTNVVAEARAMISDAESRSIQVFDYRDNPMSPDVRFTRSEDRHNVE